MIVTLFAVVHYEIILEYEFGKMMLDIKLYMEIRFISCYEMKSVQTFHYSLVIFSDEWDWRVNFYIDLTSHKLFKLMFDPMHILVSQL